MSPDQILDAITTVITAAVGYGALRHEIRALRSDFRALEATKRKEHDEFRERLTALERAA